MTYYFQMDDYAICSTAYTKNKYIYISRRCHFYEQSHLKVIWCHLKYVSRRESTFFSNNELYTPDNPLCYAQWWHIFILSSLTWYRKWNRFRTDISMISHHINMRPKQTLSGTCRLMLNPRSKYRQAMLRLQMDDQQFYYVLMCVLY